MRVTAVQLRGDRRDLDGTRARSVSLAASAGPADLVVFPEMAITGYVFADAKEAREVSEPAQGPTFQAWSGLARELGAWVVGGFLEADGPTLYNSALILSPDGDLASVYRKTMLYEVDRTWATPGNTPYPRFETGRGAFGVGICMDLNDERFLLWMARSKLDVVAFPTNWVDDGSDIWAYWADRVGASGATLAAANTWGIEAGVSFSGRSVILARGRALAQAGIAGDRVIHSTVSRRHARR